MARDKLAPKPVSLQIRPREEIEEETCKKRGAEEEDQEYVEFVENEAERERKRPKRTKRKLESMKGAVKNEIRYQVEEKPQRLEESDEQLEEEIAFCCAVCRCPEEIKAQYVGDEYIRASSHTVPHRTCCHRVQYDGRFWTTDLNYALATWGNTSVGCKCVRYDPRKDINDQMPVEAEKENNEDEVFHDRMIEIPIIDGTESDPVLEDAGVVYQKYKWYKAQENEMRRLDNSIFEKDRVSTIPSYVEMKKNFIKIRNNQSAKKGAVVLDLFGGMGTGILCLKRLGIKIKRIIHVEHDEVANAVSAHWHNKERDQISHTRVRKFEKLESRLNDYLEKYGPIDIVMGGPPCTDYSGANAYRRGTNGNQGSYLLRTGHIVKAINKFNAERNHIDCFFLVENVILFGKDLELVKQAFGIGWEYDIDSRDFTPIRRKRHYFSNIPMLRRNPLVDPPPRLCLDDRFDIAGHIMDPSLHHCKVNTLMASRSRLDDLERMGIYKENSENPRYLEFYCRAPTVTERERLMGFPVGYVSQPMKELYSSLVKKGLSPGEQSKDMRWKVLLERKYHAFAGDFHGFKGEWPPFKFLLHETKGLKISMAPPIPESGDYSDETQALDCNEDERDRDEEKKRSSGQTSLRRPLYYTEEQYAKRLLGNSFSVPVVEFLLSSIRGLFPTKDYGPPYNQPFAWSEWTGHEGEIPRRSPRVDEYIRHPENNQPMVLEDL